MIRAMRTADAAAVAALIRESFAALPVALDPAPSAGRVTTEDIAAQLATDGGAVFEESGVQGCVLWRPRDGGLYLGRLAVRPGWQRRGIARMLLDAVEVEARRRGLSLVLLEVRLPLEGNRRLFAGAGFVEVSQHAHPGYGAPTFALAEKRLDGDTA